MKEKPIIIGEEKEDKKKVLPIYIINSIYAYAYASQEDER